MAKFGIDKFAEDLGNLLAATLHSQFDVDAVHIAQSPIERLFVITFLCAAKIHPDNPMHVAWSPQSGQLPDAVPSGYDVIISRQIRVLDWPVDFVILAQYQHDETRPMSRLAIECDGHDFHERTKEQAAKDRSRDRALQAAGYTVMRFTGSELYRDPLKCVEEVLRWCSKHAWGAG
jgi:very-short-patch-repair endonuclease